MTFVRDNLHDSHGLLLWCSHCQAYCLDDQPCQHCAPAPSEAGTPPQDLPTPKEPAAEVIVKVAPQAKVRLVSDGDAGVAGEKHG